MQNYFNYFTEIEERFQKRRGTALLLNTLDWALIDTWRDAGIPIEAALQGIDNAFDKHNDKHNNFYDDDNDNGSASNCNHIYDSCNR